MSQTAIIAECCQNHNGDFDVLAEMVDRAAEAGATHVKMQTIYARNVAFRPEFEEGLEQGGVVEAIKRPYQAEVDRLSGLEIDFRQTEDFVKRCEAAGVVPMTTCFARENAKSLAEIGFKAIKVASYDCASFPMLRELKSLFSTIIVSTGATYDDEIRHAANILEGHDYAFLHCVTIYPTPLDEMHLARMEFLRTLCSTVGFSDHSLVARDGIVAAKAALAMGAELIERHYTLKAPDQTKDGPVSITPDHIRELASFAGLSVADRVIAMDEQHSGWRASIGDSNRSLSHAELLNREYYRGRFASNRPESVAGRRMIFNWEEVPLS